MAEEEKADYGSQKRPRRRLSSASLALIGGGLVIPQPEFIVYHVYENQRRGETVGRFNLHGIQQFIWSLTESASIFPIESRFDVEYAVPSYADPKWIAALLISRLSYSPGVRQLRAQHTHGDPGTIPTSSRTVNRQLSEVQESTMKMLNLLPIVHRILTEKVMSLPPRIPPGDAAVDAQYQEVAAQIVTTEETTRGSTRTWVLQWVSMRPDLLRQLFTWWIVRLFYDPAFNRVTFHDEAGLLFLEFAFQYDRQMYMKALLYEIPNRVHFQPGWYSRVTERLMLPDGVAVLFDRTLEWMLDVAFSSVQLNEEEDETIFFQQYIPIIRNVLQPQPTTPGTVVISSLWSHFPLPLTRQWLVRLTSVENRRLWAATMREQFKDCLAFQSPVGNVCHNYEGNLTGEPWCDVPRWALHREMPLLLGSEEGGLSRQPRQTPDYCYDIRELLQNIANQVQGSANARPAPPQYPFTRGLIPPHTIRYMANVARQHHVAVSPVIDRILEVYDRYGPDVRSALAVWERDQRARLRTRQALTAAVPGNVGMAVGAALPYMRRQSGTRTVS